MPVATCLSTAELRLLIDGQSSEQDIARLEEHVAGCASCLEVLKKALTPRDTLNDFLPDTSTLGEAAPGEASTRPIVEALMKRLEKLKPAGGGAAADMLVITCGGCGKKLKVKAELAGKKVKCPTCGQVTMAQPSGPAGAGDQTLASNLQEEPQTPKKSNEAAADTFAFKHIEDETTGDTSELWDFLAPPQASDEIGRLGSYRVLKVLGHGGMGVVFKAEDPGLQRMIALKAMLPAVAASASAKKRFLREARAAAALKHDNIVSIYQVGEDRGAPFLAMEFLQGEPLDERLKRDNVLALAEVLKIGREVAEGLATAHDHGLIHRDIKPGNVWLEKKDQSRRMKDESKTGSSCRIQTSSFRCKILDFGLARSAGDQTNLTQSGAIIGTPAYMAPEQASGKSVDHRCDLFSLGAMLYRLCTGELPFKGDNTLAILSSLARENPQPPLLINMELPTEISDLIMRLLAKNPDERPASAHEVADALHALEADADKTAVLGSKANRSARTTAPAASAQPERGRATAPKDNRSFTPTNRRVALATLAVGLLAAVAAGIVFYLPSGNGTIRVEINDPDIEVVLTKTGARIKTADKQGEVVVSPGEHKLKVKRGNLELETDQFILKKGEMVTVKVEWLAGRLAVAKTDGTALGSKTEGNAAWKPTPEQQAFLDAVARLPLKNRIQAVTRKIQELNKTPATNEAVQLVLEPKEGELSRCRIPQSWTHDIWPLAALTSLTSVDLEATRVVDFRPLTRLPLTELQVRLILDNMVSEEALKSMATLTKVNDRPAKDYWAERAEIRKEIDKMAAVSSGLPSEDQQTWVRGVFRKLHPKVPEGAFNAISVGKSESGLNLFRGYDLHAGVFDFSPVRALPVEQFFLLDGGLFDATPLAKTKLKVCSLNRGNRVRDLAPFAGLPLTSLHFAGAPVNLKPLAGMKLKTLIIGGTDLTPLKGMPLESLDIVGASDLSPLQGMPLKRLTTGNYSPVSDLSPLKGMPLEVLYIDRSKVTDLSPLAGMKLKELAFWGSPVADITPLKGMPLTTLDIGRAILDPTLATIPLKELSLVLRLYSEAEEKVLRSLKLEKINGMTPADFWKDVEKRRKADEGRIAEMTKVPLDPKALEKALWICGQYPKVKIVDGELVEAHTGHCNGGLDNPFAVFLAFPKLRKLSLDSGGDYSALAKLPLLEELQCRPQEVLFNLPALKLMPKLKTINGKPAKEVLGK